MYTCQVITLFFLGTVSNLRQLYRRQTDLAYKALGDEEDANGNIPHKPAPKKNEKGGRGYDHGSDEDDGQSIVWSEFSFGKPNEKLQTRKTSRQETKEPEKKIEKNPLGHLFAGSERATSPTPDYGTESSGGMPSPPRMTSQGTLINFNRNKEPSPPPTPPVVTSTPLVSGPGRYSRQASQDSHHSDRSQSSYGATSRKTPSPPPPMFPPPSPPRSQPYRSPSPPQATTYKPPSPPQPPRAPSPARSTVSSSRSMSPVRGPYGIYGGQTPDITLQDRRPSDTSTPLRTLNRNNSADNDEYVSTITRQSKLIFTLCKIFQSKFINIQTAKGSNFTNILLFWIINALFTLSILWFLTE